MSNISRTAFSRLAKMFARRFGWACAGTLATVGIAPANAAIPQPPSNQSMQANSIPERLRIIREQLGPEDRQKVDREKQAPRFTQWYNGR